MVDEKYIRELVIARLRSMPPNIEFSVGSYGDFSRDELIEYIQEGSDVGKAVIEMELNFLRNLPKIAAKISG